ncbi:HRDC domain-containing protein [Ferviditalea candida]|uniref:HRDC domain-containing protein n=1 Tax=Ferviditalea candida TaxID=3108399 RepID=A0ABU5ZIY4_9BACL|nr:HRDC domain-containing protein [Paenibacillaceae bacterium T2]
MNVVFMHSLEKSTADTAAISAQVSIAEEHGRWQVCWSEPGRDGKNRMDFWYEGDKWEELMNAFRWGISNKIAEGFMPLFGEFFNESGSSRAGSFSEMLQYYAEAEPANPELFDKLAEWRKKASMKDKKPPFLLATNRELKMICRYLPQSLEELKQIPGFGPAKVNAYADEILALTQPLNRQTDFPLDWVAGLVEPREFSVWRRRQQALRSKAELEKQGIKKMLLQRIAEGANLSRLQEASGLPRRTLLQWVEQLDREGYDMEPLIELELRDMPEEKLSAAWKAFENEGEQYLKPVLMQSFSEQELASRDINRCYEWLRFLRIRYRKREQTKQQAS